MLDIQFIRENSELVTKNANHKGYEVDVTQLLGFDSKRRELLGAVEELRRQRNELTLQAKGAKPSDENMAKAVDIKNKLSDLEHQLSSIELEYSTLLKSIPNMALDYVPVGNSEEQNVIIKTVGDEPVFDFEPKPHWEILADKNMLDKERATKISGNRFAYLKGGIVRLQFAIISYVMDTLGSQEILSQIIKDNDLNISDKPFAPVIPPALLRTEPYVASARLNAEEMTYKIDGDDLWLNASAEHTLCTMYWNETIPESELPVRYLGYSPSFRREAGTYGKDTEGIIRLHQFDKLEMEIFSSADTGLAEHKLLIALQEYLVQQLKLRYQYIQKCTFDIGKPNATGVDINCWYPGQKRFIETHTADYMTDYQSRDLNTKTKKDGISEYVHTNDATAFALGRILAAIVENYQDKDGNITVPEALKPYIGGLDKI